MAIVNEVITQFSFQGSTAPLREYNGALGKSIGLLASMAAGIVAAAGAITAFTISTTKSLDPMIQLSRSTGVAIGNLQELGFVASVTGSSSQALQSSISGLSEKIGEAAQKGSEEFARLGISVRDVNGEVKGADTVLLEIGKRFDDLDLSIAEKRSFAQQLGIDPSLVQLLSLTGSELDKTRAKARALGIVTKEQADAAVSLNDSYTMMNFGLDGLRNAIAVGLAPQIQNITDGFIDFLVANKDVISDGISKVLEIITALAKAVVRLTPLITGIAAAFGVWKIASIGLGSVLGAIFSPVAIVTAGITALILIVDDLLVALGGGKSVIADFFQTWLGVDIVPIMQSALDAFNSFLDSFIAAGANVFDTFYNLFKGVFSLLTGDIDGAGDHFMQFFVDVGDTFTNGIAHIKSLLGSLADSVLVTLTGLSFSEVGTKIADQIITPIRNTFSSMFDWIVEKFKSVGDLIGGVTSFLGFDSPEEQTPAAQKFQEQTAQPVLLNADDVPVGVNLVTTEARLPEAESQNLERPLTIRDAAELQPVAMPETEQPRPVDMLRDVSLLNRFEQFGEPDMPEINPLALSRAISINNQVSQSGIDLAALNTSSALTIEGQAQQQLAPLPQTVSNSNDRSVTIEQNNQFSITGEQARVIGNTVVDRLQDQLDDAATQLPVGGF